MQALTQNWQDILIGFILLGILLFLLFRFFQYIFPLLLKNKKALRLVNRFLPFIETGSWLAFFSWYTLKFYGQYNIYTLVVLGIIIIIIFWISRFLMKELIAGVVFRVADRFREGDNLQTEQYTGTIKKLHFDCIEMEASDGQIIFIPYSKITGEISIKNESTGQTTAYTFKVETSDISDPDTFSNKIISLILSLPWSSVNNQPKITLIEQESDRYTFEVTCYPIDKSYAKKIEQKVQEKFK